MKTLIASILFLGFVTASHAIEFIDTISEAKVFDGALTIKTEKKSDFLVYSISNAKHHQGISQAKIEGSWFIAPESPEKVWIYDGGKILMLFEITEKGVKLSASSVLPDLQRCPSFEVFSAQGGVTQRSEAPLWGRRELARTGGRAMSITCVAAGLISLKIL